MRPTAGDDGFTLIELLIVVAIIAIITAFATSSLIRSRAAANEASAIATIRVTFSAQKAYALSCGFGAYATGYTVLGAAIGSSPPYVQADLAVASPVKAGYTFTLVPGAGSIAGPTDCAGRPTITAFYGSGTPISVWNGARSFATNGNGTIWILNGSTAPTEPFGPPARTLQ